MKLYSKINVLFLGIIGFVSTSCSDYLDKDPGDELTMDMVYQNKTKVESALAYVYSGLPTPGSGLLKNTGWEIFADDITMSKKLVQYNWNNIDKIFGQWTPNTTWDPAWWMQYPRYIRESYLFRQNVKALPKEGLPQSEVDNMKNECRFLAAYYWWNLAKVWGPIPFKPDYIAPTDYTLSDLQVARTPFDSVVAYCDKEMLEVSKKLPATYTSPEKYGRITSIMCLTERARMLVFAASPLCNGNQWYKNYTNHDGTHLFSTTYDKEKWVKAAEACKQLLDEADKAGYKLYTEFNDDGSIDPFSSCENMFFTEWKSGNREILFPYTKNDFTENVGYYEYKVVTKEFGGSGGLGVYQGLVDAFFTKNGLPIKDTRSGYAETGFSSVKETRDTKWKEGTGNVGEVTPVGTYKMYCNREPRFYTTVSYNGSWYTLAGRPYDFLKGGKDNDGTHDAPTNGYLVRKKVYPYDSWLSGGAKRTSRPYWLYRLAGAYLDYAEAENEAYDTDEARKEALKYVNKVRERAGVRQYTTAVVDDEDENYIHIDDTQEAVRKVVRMERRVELCCEGTRWDDIRRWMEAETLPEVMGSDYGMDATADNTEAFYNRTVYQTRIWKKAYYWFPIYVAQMDKNPNLVQSPFWN